MSELEDRHWRLYTLMAIIIGCIIVLVFRLFYIQLVQHDYYRSLAAKEHWRSKAIPAHRGTIYDSGSSALAESVSFESLYADTGQISHPDMVAGLLAPILGDTPDNIKAKLAVKQVSPVLIKRFLPFEVAEKVHKLGVWGLILQMEEKRVYPQGSLCAQLIGVIGADGQGLSGIEARFNKDLAGQPGSSLAERDTSGDEIYLSMGQYVPPIDGADVTLTIDRYIQYLAERELEAAVRKHQAAGGTILVMDPTTGAILAVANQPTVDLNDPALYQPSKVPLYKNPAISDVYEPGSIFKVVTMAAALDAKAVTPDFTYMNQGFFAYGGGIVRNAAYRPPGPETMTQVLQRSSNIGAAYVATRLGAEKFYHYVKAFGLGQPTGIELDGESPGIVRFPTQPDWHPFDLAANAFGQGISVTPLQMATALSAVVNGGILMKPYVVKEVNGPGGHRQYYPTVVRQVISPETAQALREMLVSVVEVTEGGQVRLARVPGYRTGGKTGTAQVPGARGYNPDETIASFIGFGPADDPRFVIVVKVVAPKDTPWGETVAAPVFRSISQQLFVYMKIPPTQTQTAER
ncbi:MAG: penicillin-binding protein 2 [Chloroflexi bacterium]|nr:penicillin-binding protein 2 [Chloroflexota bacterium]MCL5075654.1 penicillin-binding protein 2 [Chloroflexota bacterium]